MEHEAIYQVTNETPPRESTLRAIEQWSPPEGGEIKGMLQRAGWSGVQFSKVLGIDPRTVRRWTGDEKTIPYPAWAILCVQAGYGPIWNTPSDEE